MPLETLHMACRQGWAGVPSVVQTRESLWNLREDSHTDAASEEKVAAQHVGCLGPEAARSRAPPENTSSNPKWGHDGL